MLCHLWRRSDKNGICYPAVRSITKKCLLADRTVWRALKFLEGTGLLNRKRNYRQANTYCLKTPPAITAMETVISSGQSPNGMPCQSPSQMQCQSPHMRGRKGSPFKVPQLRESELPTLPEWPASIAENIATILAEKVVMPVNALHDAYARFRRNKLAFQDAPPLRDADVWASFQGWLETSNDGRHLRNTANPNGKPTPPGNPVSPKEPASWRDILPEDDEDRLLFGKTPWERILPSYYQDRIIKKMAKLENQKRTSSQNGAS